MKSDIHPKMRQVIFEDTANGARFKASSAIQTDQTVEIAGQEYPLVRLDVTSASHPFYTGKQRILDTAGRVEKFGNRFGGKLSLSKFTKKKA
jgi:large subunit ribosomal protein L31